MRLSSRRNIWDDAGGRVPEPAVKFIELSLPCCVRMARSCDHEDNAQHTQHASQLDNRPDKVALAKNEAPTIVPRHGANIAADTEQWRATVRWGKRYDLAPSARSSGNTIDHGQCNFFQQMYH